MVERDGQVNTLLRQWSGGEEQALEQLVPIIYKELRRLAHYHLRREREGHTLQTTALVHEVYLRLCGQDEPQWEDRAHFFAVASRIMRRILVDYSRRRGAEKRGGARIRSDRRCLVIPVQEQFDLLALDDALDSLAFDERKCKVVEMRFFAGLPAKEIALVLKTTEATVRRDWIIAKGWLFRYLRGTQPGMCGDAHPRIGRSRARYRRRSRTAGASTGRLSRSAAASRKEVESLLAAYRRSGSFLGERRPPPTCLEK